MSRNMKKQQNECAPSEDSDQPRHPPSLINVFAVRMKKPWVLSYLLSAQWRLRSVCADAQADLSLFSAHSHFVGFVMSQLKYYIFLFYKKYTENTTLRRAEENSSLILLNQNWIDRAN